MRCKSRLLEKGITLIPNSARYRQIQDLVSVRSSNMELCSTNRLRRFRSYWSFCLDQASRESGWLKYNVDAAQFLKENVTSYAVVVQDKNGQSD